jgi:hypothetical protein
MAAMQSFLADYSAGLVEGRYLNILALGGVIVPYLEGGLDILCAAGDKVSIERVSDKFQRGACKMLRIQSADG